MKLKILLLTMFLSSNICLGQTRKGQIMVSPELFILKNARLRRLDFGVSTSMHFFVFKQLSIGVLLKQDIGIYNPKDSNLNGWKVTYLQLVPEIQWNILNKKFTPFIKLRLFEDQFHFQHIATNNPAVPIEQRNAKSFVYNKGLMRYSTGIGLNYGIMKGISLIGTANFSGYSGKLFFNSYGIGAQFPINKKMKKSSRPEFYQCSARPDLQSGRLLTGRHDVRLR